MEYDSKHKMFVLQQNERTFMSALDTSGAVHWGNVLMDRQTDKRTNETQAGLLVVMKITIQKYMAQGRKTK